MLTVSHVPFPTVSVKQEINTAVGRSDSTFSTSKHLGSPFVIEGRELNHMDSLEDVSLTLETFYLPDELTDAHKLAQIRITCNRVQEEEEEEEEEDRQKTL